MIDVDNLNTTYQDIITTFVLNTMLHHVGMLWMIETHEQLKYNMDKHNSEFITGGPWYNTYICNKLYGKVFELFIRNARTDGYNITCSIDDYSSGGGFPLPSNSTTDALVLLCATIYFIGCWLKAFKKKY